MTGMKQNYLEVLEEVEKSTEELLHELQKAEDVFAFAKEKS